ncbi:MAG: hypothetical protein ACK6CY_12385 [Gemmatimonadota bacterium]
MSSSKKAAGTRLSDLVRVRRRYSRSINLERDLDVAGALAGYLVSPLAFEATKRVYDAMFTDGTSRAWTITGVYGTGKSAFAHFLLSLAGPAASAARQEALRLLSSSEEPQQLARRLRQRLPNDGYVRAVATGQREPLVVAVLRALDRGVTSFWAGKGGRKRRVIDDVRHALHRKKPPKGDTVVELARSVARASGTGLLLVIDEMGKVLEHAARGVESEDVFLLQQLAEATFDPEVNFGLVGVLHQGFGEYGTLLPLERRAEWLKVQGRFEDILFAEPADQMLRLAALAIEDRLPPLLARWERQESAAWHRQFRSGEFHPHIGETLTQEAIASVLPLHPVAALVLPILCSRYAQNDRSLFTFLASQEPHAFGRFLAEHFSSSAGMPLQRLDDVYDYFAGIAAHGVGMRPQFSRWAEINAVVADARRLDSDSQVAVKTVAALNLAAASGPLRASAALTLAALTERPGDARDRGRWQAVLDGLVARGLLTYRRQLDEYRLWEGSDYEVEAAIRARVAASRASLATALNNAVPLGAVVAQRHSYRTGTLRYFEARYVDAAADVLNARRHADLSDGVLLYWVGRDRPPVPSPSTTDGVPLVLVEVSELAALADAATEYLALADLLSNDAHLQTDGVARREVRLRLRNARTIVDRAVRSSLHAGKLQVSAQGSTRPRSAAGLRACLSDACDSAYGKSPVLGNELINRRDLPSPGARARRELIEAMLHASAQPRLGLTGDGPEVSMYISLLERTGIHRQVGGRWAFGAPTSDSGIRPLWDALIDFCQHAGMPRSVDELFRLLQAPPYGAKSGLLAVLLAAALLTHAETISVYREGSFVPTLGAEHFEILVKHPAQFTLKHVALSGLRTEVFRDLSVILRAPGAHAPTATDETILGVVRPLMRFVAGLPPATLKTKDLSQTALAVRQVLQTAREPDTLLFADLPTACGIGRIGPDDPLSEDRRTAFRNALQAALRELQDHLPRRREACARLVAATLGHSPNLPVLRRELGARARGLRARPAEPQLTTFIGAAGSEVESDEGWLDALLMVVADRPFRSWDDTDAAHLEGKLTATARRFAAFEAVHADLGRTGTEEVRHVALTGLDGRPIEQVVRFAADDQQAAQASVGDIVARLRRMSPGERAAALVFLAESLLEQGNSGHVPAGTPLASDVSEGHPLSLGSHD